MWLLCAYVKVCRSKPLTCFRFLIRAYILRPHFEYFVCCTLSVKRWRFGICKFDLVWLFLYDEMTMKVALSWYQVYLWLLIHYIQTLQVSLCILAITFPRNAGTKDHRHWEIVASKGLAYKRTGYLLRKLHIF